MRGKYPPGSMTGQDKSWDTKREREQELVNPYNLWYIAEKPISISCKQRS